jgi:hypothetical protein
MCGDDIGDDECALCAEGSCCDELKSYFECAETECDERVGDVYFECADNRGCTDSLLECAGQECALECEQDQGCNACLEANCPTELDEMVQCASSRGCDDAVQEAYDRCVNQRCRNDDRIMQRCIGDECGDECGNQP